MKMNQFVFSSTDEIYQDENLKQKLGQLSFLFASPEFFSSSDLPAWSKGFHSEKILLGCSSAGEVGDSELKEKKAVLTTISFETAVKLVSARCPISKLEDSFGAGEQLGQQLKTASPQLVFLLSKGLEVNGSAIIEGLRKVLGDKVIITGGLAGDYAEFVKTYTILNEHLSSDEVVAVGLAGEKIQFGYGSKGGWEPFGPIRKVTRSDNNILFELDGQPALRVYETYLGDKAKDLPASGLLYPFALLGSKSEETGLIRTILGIDQEKGSLTLAGDIPEGSTVRLMHTGVSGLVEGAEQAADETLSRLTAKPSPGLVLMVSCVGRKLLMGDETDEEIETVGERFPQSLLAGFYSYGEVCPFELTTICSLHNQTMTITYIGENLG